MAELAVFHTIFLPLNRSCSLAKKQKKKHTHTIERASGGNDNFVKNRKPKRATKLESASQKISVEVV